MSDTLDIPIEPPSEAEYEEVPSGVYPGRLAAFNQVEKPDWKVTAERLRKPDREPDKLQWQWDFELMTPDGAAQMSEYTTRSWHSRSNAAAIACALLGVQMLPVGQGLSTGKLVGRTCQIVVIEKTREDGSTRSYIDKVLPAPRKRQQSQQPAQEAAHAPVPAPQAVMAGAAEDDGYWASVAAMDPGPKDEGN